MTVFRILPNGARRRLPGGSVRALGANGSRYFDVSGSTSLGVDTGGVALPVVPMVGQTWLSFALAGSLTLSGTVGHTALSIGIAGVLSSAVNMRGASLLGVNLLGNLTPSVRLYGNTGMQFAAAGRLLPSVPMRGLADLAVDVIGQLSVAAVMRGQAGLGIGVYGSLTSKAGKRWRDMWRDVYEARQALLNAIDAKNRLLAKNADGKAQAAADAVVQTNVRVGEVEDGIVAEAQRITVLTGRVGNVEGTQSAQGRAISNLQTTQTSQGNTLTSHSQQLVSVQSSITTLDGKVTTNANATTALTARVVSTEAGVARADASWNVTLTANNLVSGLKSTNNGTLSKFSVLAHVFEMLSPGGADGMEIRDGFIRVWKGNSQTIIGNNFGVAGQGLMKWFGPNIGAAACTKANATSWEDDQGNAYFGGQVLQGVLRFFNSNTVVSNSATVETGMNASNGKQVAVQARFSYDAIQTYPNEASHITLGGGRTSAVIAIDRQYQGGGWVQLTTRTLIGNADVVNVNDGPSTIQWSIDGSVMYTDSANTVSRNYRTRVVSISMQEYTVTNPGPTPQLVRNQYQSIESLE